MTLPPDRAHYHHLFLDRDGVINQRLPGAYVQDPRQFTFLPGVVEALRMLRAVFSRIVVVTNQQGIGKGLMTDQQLQMVHRYMRMHLAEAGVELDGIYWCPELASQPGNCRKPAPTLAHQARADWPDIEFSQSIMVGDSRSDIEFGARLNMLTVLVETKTEEQGQWAAIADLIHYRCSSLWAFAKWWCG